MCGIALNRKVWFEDDRLIIRHAPYVYVRLNRRRAGGVRGVHGMHCLKSSGTRDWTGRRAFREQHRKRRRLGVTVAQR